VGSAADFFEHALAHFGFDSRDKCVLSGLAQCAHDVDDLFGRLAGCVDDFGNAVAKRAVSVDARVGQVHEGQIGEFLEGVCGREVSALDRFEEISDLFSIQRELLATLRNFARAEFTVSDAEPAGPARVDHGPAALDED
jgi:hypothetical protein